MAWTYSGNPGHSSRDQVRFLVGDTDTTDQLLQDGEIDWLLTQYNSPMMTAIRAVEGMIAKFSRLADEKVGQVGIQFSQKANGMRSLLADLRRRVALEDCQPFAGGISQSQKQANQSQGDLVQPKFSKDMMENHDIAPWSTDDMDDQEEEPQS